MQTVLYLCGSEMPSGRCGLKVPRRRMLRPERGYKDTIPRSPNPLLLLLFFKHSHHTLAAFLVIPIVTINNQQHSLPTFVPQTSTIAISAIYAISNIYYHPPSFTMERILEIIRLNINIARSPPRDEAEVLVATQAENEGNPAPIQPGQSPSSAQQHGSSAVGGAAAGGSQTGSGGLGELLAWGARRV
ncbi:uncharacterized protein CLUP02_09209 [Colletotrichum lupini]|uniref:Uncharacterized protein n=1 Tax=Colletotrichum lupini TaxID=145971 RepID=A0A9Q8SUJ5_9PEZI|nr:uncharacterized protein CLUP02_09209 [Colletotrichum lupini]UQC83713.1 hypothetical protein CLUP02_09209 [Colletotrichum lupini]